MPSGSIFTHCRTHLKAWISLVVIAQCLVLILYLVTVSDKGTTQQSLLDRQTGSPLTKGQDVRLVQNIGDSAGNQTKRNPEYPKKSTVSAEHLKMVANLKTAHEILHKKIGSKTDKQKDKFHKKKESALKKSFSKQKWLEKAQRHRKQKQQGFKSRNITKTDMMQEFKESKKSALNSSKKGVGRELKKVNREKGEREKRHLTTGKTTQGSFTQSVSTGFTELNTDVENTNVTRGITQSAQISASSGAKSRSFELDIRSKAIVNSSVNYTFDTFRIANQSHFPRFVSIPQVFHLDSVLPTVEYFETRKTRYSTYQCYKAGTRPQIGAEDILCSCEKGWHGKWCSFPDSLYYSTAST